MTYSMAFFVDYCLATGPRRIDLTAAGEAVDFYKPVREAIVSMHELGGDPSLLNLILVNLEVPREKKSFPAVVHGYQRWMRGQRTTWFEPPMRDLQIGAVRVRISPALGLILDGRPHVIVPYFRADELTGERVVVTNTLLRMALAETWPGVVLAVLDVRRSALHALKPGATYLPKYEALVKSTGACLEILGGVR